MEKFKKILRWVLGILSTVGALVYISTSIPTFIVWLLLAALLIPPGERLIMSRFPIKLPTIAKVIAGIALFLIAVMIAPKSQTAEQIQKVEPKSQGQVNVAATSSPTSIPQSDLYTVSSVIDGDTIQVVIDSKKETIRLIGIDSPETVDPRKPVQCFGKEASAKLKSLISGKSVRLEADQSQDNRDKYQRFLRYVFLEDGTNVNKLMVSEGFAYEYTYNTPYKYQSEFKQAQKEAEENKRGLWADNACPTSSPQPSIQTSGTSSTTTGGSSDTTGTSGGSFDSSGKFTCAGKTKCGQMVSCEEAYFYLNSCGVARLDGDKDGVPCESLCN
ncbi:thermonuclease family protein [Candidatus Daviesbacteria bacterium]|nr:thermonuclease family protein [Candidatus Daviesbacteria bacterium]